MFAVRFHPTIPCFQWKTTQKNTTQDKANFVLYVISKTISTQFSRKEGPYLFHKTPIIHLPFHNLFAKQEKIIQSRHLQIHASNTPTEIDSAKRPLSSTFEGLFSPKNQQRATYAVSEFAGKASKLRGSEGEGSVSMGKRTVITGAGLLGN